MILGLTLGLSASSALSQPVAASKKSDAVAVVRTYLYRVYLHDKQGTPYRVSQPSKFLSSRAIARRQRQGIAIDSLDLPVNPAYVQQLQSLGVKVRGTSRWHNTVMVASNDSNMVGRVSQLAFVDSCKLLYQSPVMPEAVKRTKVERSLFPDSLAFGRYGNGYQQIKQLGGLALHEAGFTGKGMRIAILDAGFRNVDRIPAFGNVRIVATKDFAPRPTKDIFEEHYHGTMVLSTMAMNRPDTMIGTAPDADYVLIRTEDIPTETPAEEDTWTMGVEFADSIGADVINSSLGYHKWDNDTVNIRLRDLNGHTTFISQTASMIAAKGMVLCNSAGNDGTSSWHKINVPADAPDILTVGAVDVAGEIAPFSSLGPAQDGRVKPDVCSRGRMAYVVNGEGMITTANGTSFASPIMCGMVACLWQANPQLTARQLIALVRRCSDRWQWPDNVYGYGIPDFSKYCRYLKDIE